MEKTTIVCIDKYEKGILGGRMYNSRFVEGFCFESTMEFLRKMDSMMEEMNFPQSFTECRVFRPVKEVHLPIPSESYSRRGTMGTFVVQVLFRQHASWQGNVTWLEEKQEEKFRSVLELLFLVDSALKVKN